MRSKYQQHINVQDEMYHTDRDSDDWCEFTNIMRRQPPLVGASVSNKLETYLRPDDSASVKCRFCK